MNDGIYQVRDLLLNVGQLDIDRADRRIGALPTLGRNLTHHRLQLGQRIAAQQLGAYLSHQLAIDQGALGSHAGAHGRAAVLTLGTAVVPSAGGDHGTAALAAAEQPTKQCRGALALAGATALARRPAEAFAHCIPYFLVDDAQLGPVLDHPLVTRAVQAGALAGVRVFHPLAAVPDQAADVQLVVEHAGALGWAAV